MSDTLAPLGAAAAAAAADVDRVIAHLDGDDLGLLSLLALVRQARQDAAMVERALEDAAAACWSGGDRITLDGEWTAERRFGAARTKWDNERLTEDVVREAVGRAMWDLDTGEAICEPNATTWAVRDALTAAARPSWRVTALREQGIDPDDYCHKEPGRATIQIILAATDEKKD